MDYTKTLTILQGESASDVENDASINIVENLDVLSQIFNSSINGVAFYNNGGHLSKCMILLP